MARPRKRGLDYFPLDVDFFQDEKMVCIAGEFGAKGELVAIKLLCAVYRNGYFAEWNDAARFKLMREMPGVSGELLQQIVSRLVFWGFFDRTLFDSACVITSRGIQQRYFEAVRRRQPIDSDLPYLLVNVDRNHINDSNNAVNADKNATKESKVKKSKEKNKPPQTPPAGELPARQGAESGKNFLEDFLKGTSDEVLARRLSELRVSREVFVHVARLVVDEWDELGTIHASRAGAVRHLYNHVRKKLAADPSLRTVVTASQRDADRARRRSEQAARDEATRQYQQKVRETGRTGWHDWCLQRGLDPETTSAAQVIGRT